MRRLLLPWYLLETSPGFELVSWLSDQGSLTKRLRDRCGDQFSLRVLNQQWVKPGIDEARLLQIPARQTVLLRQVQLFCGRQVLVYARSIIPLDTLRGPHRRLATIRRNDPLFRIALSHSTQDCHCIWGRRSLFTLDRKSLLVSEFFLPALFRR